MVNYPELDQISINGSIGDLMSFPNSIYPFYWAWIIGGIWLIISLSLYYSEKFSKGKAPMLGAMAVSSLACVILSVLGTLSGIITTNILIYVFVFAMVIIVIWFFASRD